MLRFAVGKRFELTVEEWLADGHQPALHPLSTWGYDDQLRSCRPIHVSQLFIASSPTFIPHSPYLFMHSAALLSTQECEDQLTSCTGLYVEDQLSRHFPILVEFVKKAEQQCKRLAVPEGQPIQG